MSISAPRILSEARISKRFTIATPQSIETLHRPGHSNKDMARRLSIDGAAVDKHVRQIRAASQAQKNAESKVGQIQLRPNSIFSSEPDSPPHYSFHSSTR